MDFDKQESPTRNEGRARRVLNGNRLAIAWTLLLAPLGHGAAVAGPGQCAAIKAPERTKIESYVRKKFKIPPASPLQMTETPIAAQTCYRKLDFKSSDPAN